MTNYNVSIDVRFTFEVEATSMNDALEKATHFQETMKHTWGDNAFTNTVTWMDSYAVKNAVSHDTDLA